MYTHIIHLNELPAIMWLSWGPSGTVTKIDPFDDLYTVSWSTDFQTVRVYGSCGSSDVQPLQCLEKLSEKIVLSDELSWAEDYSGVVVL